jgi:protein-glutamine gamma-glutamyltransferase
VLTTALPRALPRESRDTLFLLAVIGWIVLLQAPYLPPWTTAWACVVLLWRATGAWRQRPLPGRSWTTLALALTIGGSYLYHGTLIGREAGVGLIVMLLVLKTLELKAQRDATVVFFLGFFTLVTQFFHSQSLGTALGIGVALWGLMTALVQGQRPVGAPSLWASAQQAARMALLAAPLMALLFTLFPRLPPLWGMNGQGMLGRTGLSEQMTVGDIAALANDDRIALRLRFLDAAPNPQQLYMRGPVLSRFDGRQWSPALPSFGGDQRLPSELRTAGPALRYEVLLEPHRQRWLPTLEATASAPEGTGLLPRMNAELRWLNEGPVTETRRYQAQAHLDHRHGPVAPVLGLQDYLELPPGFNPQTLGWAQQLARQVGVAPNRAQALVDLALATLRTGGYAYSLSPGVFGQHTADELWFGRKVGFCEHYASAFVVLMRALDIPARVVTGYQGATLNPLDGLWAVRQRDAHAWTEVWMAGRGWVRVDPTAAVAQWRTSSAERLSTPTALGTAVNALHPALAAQLQAWWESLDSRWTLWVLDHNSRRQLDWLRQWGWHDVSIDSLWRVLAGACAVLSLAALALLLWRPPRRPRDPWLRLLERARHQMRRSGVVVAPHSPPAAMAQAWRRGRSTTSGPDAVTQWLQAMETQRYSGAPDTTLATLQQQFRRLHWPPPISRL